MTEPPSRYDVIITVDKDDGHLHNPVEFAVAAGQAAAPTQPSSEPIVLNLGFR
jgi:hypothetical protein